MKNFYIAVSATVLVLGLNGCWFVKPDVYESDNYLTIQGTKFRKSGAIRTDFLYAGVKRSSGVNSFDPKFLPYLDHEITARHVTEAFDEQTGKAAWEAAAKAGIELAEGSVSGSGTSESKVTGKFSVFTLFDVNKFVTEINSPQNQENLDLLKRYDTPRIITSVATVFNRESSKKTSKSGNLTLKIKNPQIGSPEFSVKAESSGESIAKLSDGTIFAYEYARICWEKHNGKVQVATLEVDRPGIDGNCPAGTKDDASKL
ncbi:MAG: hypothetical protein PHU14_08650 [Methylovulum sp.]|nr:hypothetical protein [Methylovulum sp.]